MEGIRQWAFSVCCAMVACGIVQILAPKSGMEKMLKLCVSVFFLCCLLSPVVFQNPGLRVQVQQYSQEEIDARAHRLTAVVEEQTQQSVQAKLTKIVEEKLQEKGINYQEITIHINTNGQHGDEQFRAEITLDRTYQDRHDALRGELSSELGLEVRLGYE